MKPASFFGFVMAVCGFDIQSASASYIPSTSARSGQKDSNPFGRAVRSKGGLLFYDLLPSKGRRSNVEFKLLQPSSKESEMLYDFFSDLPGQPSERTGVAIMITPQPLDSEPGGRSPNSSPPKRISPSPAKKSVPPVLDSQASSQVKEVNSIPAVAPPMKAESSPAKAADKAASAALATPEKKAKVLLGDERLPPSKYAVINEFLAGVDAGLTPFFEKAIS